jgi:hypothetical protein
VSTFGDALFTQLEGLQQAFLEQLIFPLGMLDEDASLRHGLGDLTSQQFQVVEDILREEPAQDFGAPTDIGGEEGDVEEDERVVAGFVVLFG